MWQDLQFVQAGPQIRDLPSASPTGIDGSAFDECYVPDPVPPNTLRYGDVVSVSGNLYRVVHQDRDGDTEPDTDDPDQPFLEGDYYTMECDAIYTFACIAIVSPHPTLTAVMAWGETPAMRWMNPIPIPRPRPPPAPALRLDFPVDLPRPPPPQQHLRPRHSVPPRRRHRPHRLRLGIQPPSDGLWQRRRPPARLRLHHPRPSEGPPGMGKPRSPTLPAAPHHRHHVRAPPAASTASTSTANAGQDSTTASTSSWAASKAACRLLR